MKKRIAINGFGRIGRLALRGLLNQDGVEVVAINDLTDVNTLAHLFRRDSVHGTFDGTVEVQNENLVINGQVIEDFSERNPENLPWERLGVDLVVECTGVFRDPEGAGKHIQAGASKVLISAPATGGIKTIVLGVNDEMLTEDDNIVSNASCTTNCLAPMVKALDEAFGLERGYITTIHAYTADQRLQDAPHKDLRRARAAALNMVPTTTGAAAAVGMVLPHLNGKLDGLAVRVPVPDGSLTDLVATVGKEVTAEEVNAVMKAACGHSLNGIVEYSVDPIVSSDIVGNPYSCIFDSQMTKAEGNMIKVFGWYDNEMGYATRLVEVAVRMCAMTKEKVH